MIDAVAPADLRQNFQFFLMKLRRNDDRNRFSDDLMVFVAVDTARRRIPRRNDTIA